MKIYSWNVNGLRAVINKGALQEFISKEYVLKADLEKEDAYIKSNRN